MPTAIGFPFLPPTDFEHHELIHIQVDRKQLVPLCDIYIGFSRITAHEILVWKEQV